MDVSSMEIEATITEFIEFFVGAMQQSPAQPGVEPLREEDIQAVATMLRMTKTLFVAQKSVMAMMREMGFNPDELGEQ